MLNDQTQRSMPKKPGMFQMLPKRPPRPVRLAAVVIMGIVAAVALAAWAYLAVGHGWFWRTGPGLHAGAELAEWPEVVAVVPARDEAALLPETLPSLLGQEYPGRFRVVLADDGSGDGTAEVAERLGRAAATELRVVRVGERPAGWAGKVWAMAEGVRVAGEPEFVLFTDADIAYAPGTLTRLVRAGEVCDLVSQMATLRTRSGWERAIVPAFVYFFSLLYPFRRVGRPGARTAAAAGGCMLVRRSTLEGAGGLAAISGALIDDVALGRLLKRYGGRCRLDLSRDVVSLRPYPHLADLWAMIARSAYTQLRYSPPLLAGTLLGLALLFVVPPTATVAGAVARSGPVAGIGLAAWAIMAVTYVPMLRFYRLSVWRAPALPLVAIMYAGMTLDSARRHHTGQGGTWKGRALLQGGAGRVSAGCAGRVSASDEQSQPGGGHRERRHGDERLRQAGAGFVRGGGGGQSGWRRSRREDRAGGDHGGCRVFVAGSVVVPLVGAAVVAALQGGEVECLPDVTDDAGHDRERGLLAGGDARPGPADALGCGSRFPPVRLSGGLAGDRGDAAWQCHGQLGRG
jgi:hopene-associated glycosyltransferase HpnB